MKSFLTQKHFFITGTGTDIGKTVVTRALLQYIQSHDLKAVGYKPIKISHDNFINENMNNDAKVLCSSSSFELPEQVINPFLLLESEILSYKSPDVEFNSLSMGLNTLKQQVDSVIVEGTSGWRVLLSNLMPFSQWVVQEKLPVIMVVGIQAGCLNHAMLTAEAILNDGLQLAGWIANRINPGLAYYEQIINALDKVIPAPKLGELPYMSRPEEKNLSCYIDLTPLQQS